MKHLGDITKIDGTKIEPVDVITGGSPCQDLSVAGLRAGLDGERSGLFMEQIRIVKEMRANEISNGRSGRNVRPRYMVWENVCGAFSSNGGKDFQTVLTEIARIVEPEAPDVPMPERGGWSKSGCIYSSMGKWSIAWRLHDAQFWGVPQRRKRIALVADFGGLSAPEILFERKGVSGYTEPGKKQKQGTSGEIGSGSESADRERERERRSCGVDIYNLKETEEVSATVTTSVGQSTASGGKVMQEQEVYGVTAKGNGDAFIAKEKHTALSVGGGEPGQGYPCVMAEEQIAYGMSPYHSNCMLSDNPHSGIYKADTSRTLDLNGGNPNCNQGGIMVVTPTAENAGGGRSVETIHGEQISPTMISGIYKQNGTTQDAMTIVETRGGHSEIMPTLCAAIAKQTGNQNDEFIVAQETKLPQQ